MSTMTEIIDEIFGPEPEPGRYFQFEAALRQRAAAHDEEDAQKERERQALARNCAASIDARNYWFRRSEAAR